MSRLLILGCSATKRPDNEPLPAIERYDGPIYQTLRACREEGLVIPKTLILSAEHGIIFDWQQIYDYDRILTPSRVAEFQRQRRVFVTLARITRTMDLAEVLIVAGSQYVTALRDQPFRQHSNIPLPFAIDWFHQPFGWARGARVVVADGGIGMKRKQLREWLQGLAEVA